MTSAAVFTIDASCLTLGHVLARGSANVTLYSAKMRIGKNTTQVAVKRLASSGAPTGAERAFVEEIQTLQLASTVCQRSCRILGCCKLDGDLCIVMSLYAGSAAQRLQESRGPLELQELVVMATEVLEALSQLHDAHILHLDLKPGNILLDAHGHAYLADFGISRVLKTLEECTSISGPTGTPHYMAPEQADAEFGSRGRHTDAWGIAACILHLATGQQPYLGLSMFQMVSAMLKSRPPDVPNSLPEWLQQVLKQCFSFDAAKRPSVSQLLKVFLEHSSTVEQSEGDLALAPLPAICRFLCSQQPVFQQRGLVSLQQMCKDTGYSSQFYDAVLKAGVVPPLLALLKSQQHDVQYEAVCNVHNLCAPPAAFVVASGQSIPKFEEAIIDAGALPSIVDLLQSPSARCAATGVLIGLIAHDNQRIKAVVASGALPILVNVMAAFTPDSTIQRYNDAQSVSLLASLIAGDNEMVEPAIAAGVLPALVAYCRVDMGRQGYKGAGALRRKAMALATQLCKATQASPDAFITSGVLAAVVAMMSKCYSYSHYSVNKDPWLGCMELMQMLARGSRACKEAVLASGALDLLVKCHVEMDHWYYRQETDDRLARVLAMEVDEDDQFAQLQEEDQVEELSLEVMQLLAFDSQAKHAIIAAGALGPLVDWLPCSPLSSTNRTTVLLCSLAHDTQSRKAIVKAGAVRPLARALKSQSLFKRQSAMQILHKLAQGSKACQLQLEAMLTSQHPEVEKLCTMFEQL